MDFKISQPHPDRTIFSVAALLAELRRRRPRVHCLTNIVAQAFTANVLLAAGAVPSMTTAPDEVADFTARSDALLVNIGTLDPVLREAIPIAVEAARRAGKPWAFDPVLIDRSDPRLALARTIVAGRPAVLRANATEFAALSGEAASPEAVAAFARAMGGVVAVTGEVDLVTDGARVARVANGHSLMAQVTAVGCAGTALIAAFASLTQDTFAASASALAFLGLAGEHAARESRGPGSFAVALLDALATLTPEAAEAGARIADVGIAP